MAGSLMANSSTRISLKRNQRPELVSTALSSGIAELVGSLGLQKARMGMGRGGGRWEGERGGEERREEGRMGRRKEGGRWRGEGGRREKGEGWGREREKGGKVVQEGKR